MVAQGITDSYVDAFCGRIPRSILARHYLDYSRDKLRELYDKTNLRVLS
jgi:intergrase/recombinase